MKNIHLIEHLKNTELREYFLELIRENANVENATIEISVPDRADVDEFMDVVEIEQPVNPLILINIIFEDEEDNCGADYLITTSEKLIAYEEDYANECVGFCEVSEGEIVEL